MFLVDKFFDIMFIIVIGLFIVVEGIIVFCVIKFCWCEGDDSDGVNFRENLLLEIFWIVILFIIVICFGIYSVDIYR